MTPYYSEPNQILYCGHILEVLKELPAESIDMCMTSPPYWGLRIYKTEPQIWPDGWCGELGLEPTIELYISHLLQIFDEVKRVLKKTGTCWVNIGDSYASGKGTCFNPGGGKGSFSSHGDRKDSGVYPLDRGNVSMLKAEGLLPKSLCGIPERFVLGMQDRGWIRRNTIIWYKRNPMPESVKDRFTEDFEYLYFFSKQGKYYFEQQFEPIAESTVGRGLVDFGGAKGRDYEPTADDPNFRNGSEQWGRTYDYTKSNIHGRNKRCVWEINTEPYPEAHFATFPEKLCETPILAGCPAQICVKCGKAREKIYENGERIETGGKWQKQTSNIGNTEINTGYVQKIDAGYTDCGCNTGFESGVILDPFCGSGTVMAVAKKLGRKAIGLDLNPKYCDLTVKRLQKIPLNLL